MSILTINSGSSSLKFGLYQPDGAHLLLSGSATQIGKPASKLEIKNASGEVTFHSEASISTQADALSAIAEHLTAPVTAIGHRIVHGGPHLVTHQPIIPQVLETLRRSIHFAPLHIPPAIALIEATEKRFPGVPQFACFDTAFHQTMPAEAYTYPIPRVYRKAGVRRYGFHGLSYESIVHALHARSEPAEPRGAAVPVPGVPQRLIVAHLGSGSSICALLGGQSIDTSMGVSPAGGIPMGTRSGDLDPGVLLLLERDLSEAPAALTPDRTEHLLNHDAGLQALADEADMQALLARTDPEAVLAVTIFCRDAAKTIAGYAAVLGGLEMLVFTGGIGEHSQPVRRQICDFLGFLGLALAPDPEDGRLSTVDSTIAVWVIDADEDGQIARHVAVMQR